MIGYVCERVHVTHDLCKVLVKCNRQFFLPIHHISVDVIFRSSRVFSVQVSAPQDNTVHTNVLTSLIASASGMEQAFHRVVNSHILRFAIAMRVGETGVGCHTGWLSHCQYLIRWIAVPCGDLHVTCA